METETKRVEDLRLRRLADQSPTPTESDDRKG